MEKNGQKFVQKEIKAKYLNIANIWKTKLDNSVIAFSCYGMTTGNEDFF